MSVTSVASVLQSAESGAPIAQLSNLVLPTGEPERRSLASQASRWNRALQTPGLRLLAGPSPYCARPDPAPQGVR